LTSARRVPAHRRHPHAEHTTVEQRPCLSWARSRVSTDPRRVHFPACRHPVSVPLSCAYCRHCAIATAVPPTFYPHTPTPGRGPVLPGRTCARALTHTRGRSQAYVPQPTPPGHSSPFSLSLFPCLVHAINFVSLPLPSRRRSARTRTHATEGPSPLLHLSVTVLDVPPCRRHEPQRTGARVSVEPSTPSSNLFGCLDPEHRLA
jgi:hypothetical protein